MKGIFKKSLTPEEAAKKYGFYDDIYDVTTEGDINRFKNAISSEYTLPKRVLEKFKDYVYSPLAMKIQRIFI